MSPLRAIDRERADRLYHDLAQVARALQAARVQLFACDFDSGTVTELMEWETDSDGSFDPLRTRTFPLQILPASFVQAHQQGQLVDIEDVRTMAAGPFREDLHRRGIKSLVALPLMQTGTCLGCVTLAWTLDRAAFGDHELSLLKIVTELLVRGLGHRENEAEAREAEEAANEKAYFFRESQRAALIGSYKTDFVRGWWFSSEILDEIFGIGPEYRRDVEGWLNIVHPDDRAMMDAYLKEEVFAQRRNFWKEYRIVRANDAAVRWVVGFGNVTYDAAGRPLGMIGTIQDIHDRKQADMERGRLLEALRQSDETILITDTQGKIQYVNPAFERSSGYSVEEALGQNPRILKGGTQGEDYYRELWRTISGGNTWKGRLVNRRKDGRVYTEDASITPVRDERGTIVSYVAVKRDITEHIRLELALAQAQKMESVGRLAGGVAHDFNNMLSVILGYAEMALQKELKDEPIEFELIEIRQAAERSAALTKQLLAFARMQPVAPKVLDLDRAVEGLLSMLPRLLGENIHLEWVPSGQSVHIKLDPTQLDQVLTNLCVNARDAMNANGKLTIETGLASAELLSLSPDVVEGQDYVRLSVRDSGSGMDAETLAHIFEPFYTTKGLAKGTGLGLATLYGIVKQNQGAVVVQSVSGQGSTFHVLFPRSSDPSTVAEKAAGEGPGIKGKERILIVEDEPAILQLTRSMLIAQGYTVITASSSSDAIRMTCHEGLKVDLLLSDVILPGKNGGQMAEQITACLPGLKTLFMSGYTADVISRQGALVEGVQFIEKPFTRRELVQKVREVLDGGD